MRRMQLLQGVCYPNPWSNSSPFASRLVRSVVGTDSSGSVFDQCLRYLNKSKSFRCQEVFAEERKKCDFCSRSSLSISSTPQHAQSIFVASRDRQAVNARLIHASSVQYFPGLSHIPNQTHAGPSQACPKQLQPRAVTSIRSRNTAVRVTAMMSTSSSNPAFTMGRVQVSDQWYNTQ
jgi:hypothetical protein